MAEVRGVVLRVFTHPACSGCTRAVQKAWELTEAHPEVALKTISLTKKEGLDAAQKEGVKTIPTFILSSGERELERWEGRLTTRGYTSVPMRVFFYRGWAKVELALGKFRRVGDKRQELRREQELKEAREMIDRGKRR